MLATKMTRKGQVTIPAEIRERLDLQEGEVFMVHEEDGKVVLESQLHHLRRTLAESAEFFTNIPPLEPGEMRRLAADSITEAGMEKLRQIELNRRTD